VDILVGTVTTARSKVFDMNEEPINEYKEPQMMTREFLEDVLRRSQENIFALKKLRAKINYDIEHGFIDEDQ